MRKIIEATLLSRDGVIGDPHEWATDYFESETQKDALARLMASDAMLMGRRTYEIFEKLWSQRTGEYFDRINSMRKYVFSSTLDRAGWNNATTVSGDVVAETAKLKRQGGQDLVIYGHGQLGRTLLRHGLIDEIRLAIQPRHRRPRQAVLPGRRKDALKTDVDEQICDGGWFHFPTGHSGREERCRGRIDPPWGPWSEARCSAGCHTAAPQNSCEPNFVAEGPSQCLIEPGRAERVALFTSCHCANISPLIITQTKIRLSKRSKSRSVQNK